MFVLLLKTRHGWTDDLGAHASNRWPSRLAALTAALQLDQIWEKSSDWRVVHVDELSQYELIA